MNYRKLILSFVAVTALAACGGGGGDDNSEDLFSTWKRETDGGILDFRGFEFGVPAPIYMVVDQRGGSCGCTLMIAGDQISGVMAVNQCMPISGTSPAECNALHSTIQYTNQGGVLTTRGPRGEARFR